ncbi:hypothetical protein [Okeania sp.]|uniref:hypothetical protein n=1 Tax=Okeania sp. TaxID=3100323 RepID=UPI002B4B8BA8|nr:hypothetical protein [Okeania sp.]MEB3341492.1 hypothetical protein [Okeania sp.]
MNNLEEEEFTIKLHPRIQEKVSLNIPTDTLASLKKVAASRDMSWEALLKFYIGNGLREDLAKSFSNQLVETTTEVLDKNINKFQPINHNNSMTTITQEEIENFRSQLANYPEALAALDEIEEEKGDLEFATEIIALEAGMGESRDEKKNWLKDLSKQARNIICQEELKTTYSQE